MQKQIIQSNTVSSSANQAAFTSRVSETPQFYLVATPIGNLEDFSYRARKTLQDCDLILCEDTRTTARLLSAYGITTRTESLHQYNEAHRIQHILKLFQEGKKIALVSDAGTPLISDPGYLLTQAILENGIAISAIPGANAALMALTLSGLPPHPYSFLGFPATKSSARQNSFATLKAVERTGFHSTYIWHEAPHRLLDMLHDLQEVFGKDRIAAVARELTKKFEEVKRGTLAELIDHFTQNAPRGEIIVLLSPSSPEENKETDNLDQNLIEALKTLSVKDAATMVATAMHLPKKIVYKRALELTQK